MQVDFVKGHCGWDVLTLLPEKQIPPAQELEAALKIIAPRLMDDAASLERFKREARAAGRLQHPNVVNVTDFGIASVDAQNVAYLAMEYLEGFTLGAGTLTLAFDNSYTGGTSLLAGRILVNNTTGSGTGTGTVSAGSGTIGILSPIARPRPNETPTRSPVNEPGPVATATREMLFPPTIFR